MVDSPESGESTTSNKDANENSNLHESLVDDSGAHENSNSQKDDLNMDSADQSTTQNVSANQKSSTEFEKTSEPNFQLSDTIEFLESEARIQQEAIEIESKERMIKAAIVIQAEL